MQRITLLPVPPKRLPRPMLPPPVALICVQPVLNRIVRNLTRALPELFARLGPHRYSRFLIDARELPFLLLLRPDPDRPRLTAVSRKAEPPCDARIGGRFRDLLGLIEGERDGDALFFSRDLDITGNLEAVVCLRNAVDDVEGAVADRVTASLGPVSRAAWGMFRRRHGRSDMESGKP